MANHYVFVAVGGTGAKVAQALVTLLSTGMPLYHADDRWQASESTQDSLSIWYVDPDSDGAAKGELVDAIQRYKQIQAALQISNQEGGLWTLQINYLSSLDPLEDFDRQGTLNKVLNSRSDPKADQVLKLLYTDADRDLNIKRGFYQKPFIGSAILASPPKKFDGLLNGCPTDNQPVKFFICGSLFGGTGASGVPGIAKLLQAKKQSDTQHNAWSVAGCLVGPYFTPPRPPQLTIPAGLAYNSFQEALSKGATEDQLRAFAESVQEANKDKGLTSEEIIQILGKYYADPDETKRKAAISLHYYSEHNEELFQQVYYLEHPEPTNYADDRTKCKWSNGGREQKNPAHAMEFIAAVCALDFFCQLGSDAAAVSSDGKMPFNVPVSPRDRAGAAGGLTFEDVPIISNKLDPAKWLLACCLLVQVAKYHIHLHEITDVKKFKESNFDLLTSTIAQNQDFFNNFKAGFNGAIKLLEEGVLDRIVSPQHEEKKGPILDSKSVVGWTGEAAKSFQSILKDELPLPSGIGFLGNKPPNPIGFSKTVQIKIRLNEDIYKFKGDESSIKALKTGSPLALAAMLVRHIYELGVCR
jgi:hypothetical protein